MIQQGQKQKDKKQEVSSERPKSEQICNQRTHEFFKDVSLGQLHDLNQSQMSLFSSSSLKRKLPQIILKYMIEQAKSQRGQTKQKKQKTTKYKLMRVAERITRRRKKIFVLSICNICELQVIENEKQSMSNCQHKYCLNCLHQYIIYKINRFETLECPNQTCTKMLDQKSKCYFQLPLDAIKKYRKIKQYEETLKNSTVRLCPNSQCDGFIKIQTHLQEGEKTNIKCKKCKKIYCPHCFYQEHKGECDPYHLKFFQTTLKYRQCSKCKNMIQKSSGCNHMTCKCGNQFCYFCGKKWNSDHNCNTSNEPNNEQVCCDSCSLQLECCCHHFEMCIGCIFNPIIALISRFCNWTWSIHCCCSKMLCCEVITKFLFAIFWLVGVLPLLLIAIVGEIILRILLGVGFGLFAFPCLLEENSIDFQCEHVVLAIVFLPFTFFYFIGLGIKTMFDQEGRQHIRQSLVMPCQVFRDLVLS